MKKVNVTMETANVTLPAFKSPLKALPKAPKLEALKVESKQPENKKQDESKQTSGVKNNNKATTKNANAAVVNESDDDDSVFINENKPKKTSKSKNDVVPAPIDASSVMLNNVNVLSSNLKTAAAQNPSSRDLNVKSETVVR